MVKISVKKTNAKISNPQWCLALFKEGKIQGGCQSMSEKKTLWDQAGLASDEILKSCRGGEAGERSSGGGEKKVRITL